MLETMYSISQASKILGVADVTLRQMAWRGDIGCVKVGRRVLLKESEIENYIQRNTKPARCAKEK